MLAALSQQVAPQRRLRVAVINGPWDVGSGGSTRLLQRVMRLPQ